MISVLLSIFNESEEYVKQSIESILNQTYYDIELIVVLDNPIRVDLKRLILAYCSKDSRIKHIFNTENLGLVASLNKALKEARGEYIARMDADDISFPDRLQEEWNLFQKDDYDLVGTYFVEIDENGKVEAEKHSQIFPTEDMMIKKYLRYANCIAHPTWMVKKSVYDSLQGYRNIPCAEDYDFLLRAALLGKKFGVLRKNGIKYRCNQNGISKSNEFKQLFVADYLSRKYRKHKMVSEEDVQKIVKLICNPEKEQKFKKGEKYLQKARICREENKNGQVMYYLLKACIISPFHIVLLIRNYHIKCIEVEMLK